MMDANEHILDGTFTRQLREELDLEEISHKAWRGLRLTLTSTAPNRLTVYGHREVWKLEALRFYPFLKALVITEQ